MSSLFDEHQTSPPAWRRDAGIPADTRPMPTGPPARPRRRFPPGLTGLLVALGVLVGVTIGHAAWSSSGATPAAGLGGIATPNVSGGAGAGVNGPNFGGSGYGGSGGYRSGGYGSSGAVARPSPNSGSSTSSESVASKVDPALVDINSTFSYQGAQGAGTGIVLSADGEILTNNHVIDGASSISVTDIGNGKTYRATVVGYDTSKDIAVLQLQGASGLSTAKLGDSSAAAVGQSVVAVGNAGGSGGTPSSAAGSITALDQSITAGDAADGSSEQLAGLIEVNAAVQPGDSGGSLVNSSGAVIGVDTAASAGFSFQSAAGQGYAIPINQAVSIAQAIETGQGSATVHIGPTAFLGVLSSSATTTDPGRFGGFANGGGPSASGAQIAGVADGTAAQKAGLAQGDVITSLDGHPVDSSAKLSQLIIGLKPGGSVKLGWIDANGQSHSATVALGTGPPA